MPVDHDDGAEQFIGVFQAVPASLHQESGNPNLDTAEGKRSRGHAECHCPVSGIASKAEKRSALRSFLERIELASLGFLQKSTARASKNPGAAAM